VAVDQQLRSPRLGPACMLQVAGKAGPAVDFHEQIGQLDQRQARVDQVFQSHERRWFVRRVKRSDDQRFIFDTEAGMAR
jgi:hypothetical protein